MEKKQFNPSYIGERNDILGLVPIEARRVLDVGCSTGALAKQIKERQNAEIIGVEQDTDMGEIAKESLDRVIISDIELLKFEDFFKEHYFDCIIFSDILEHLRDPWKSLEKALRVLGREGIVIASIPNVRHYSTLCSLVVRGSWPYRERGIHDFSHLRFFTLRNIKEMFCDAGLDIITVARNYRIIERPHGINRFSRFLTLPFLREFMVFQYLIVAKKKA